MDGSGSRMMETPWDALQHAGEQPVLAGIALALFFAGVAIDLWLVARLLKRRAAGEAGFSAQVTSKPWGLAEVGFIAATLCSMLMLTAFLISFFERAGLLGREQVTGIQLLGGAVSVDGLGLLAVFLLLQAERIRWHEAFGVRATSLGRALALAVWFLLAILPPTWLLAGASQRLCERFGLPLAPQEMAQIFLESHSIATQAGIALMAIVVAPLFEELFFRGLAYPALKQRIGLVPALLTTSVVFASIHFHVPSLLPLVALAIGLTLAYEATGNIVVPILIHGLFNTMTIVVMIKART